MDEATSDRAWLQAMLDVEAALARAGDRVGLVPAAAAARITTACRAEDIDADAVASGWDCDATPVVALVEQLRARVGPEVAPHVHVPATSQDVLDTATSLIARRAVAATAADLVPVSRLLAELARAHRDTPQVGRTLLQQGAVTTFGAACASGVAAVDDALGALGLLTREGLAVQLGGAVGSLAGVGDKGPTLVAELARELELVQPTVPWHTARGRVAELAGAIGVLCGALASVAQDLVLLSSTEIGEVRLAATGGSSTMPHKRNPAPAVLALAAAHRVPGLVATVLGGMPQELQRSTGRWQAEWATVTELLRLLGGVARHTRAALDGLEIDTERMRAHVDELLAGAPLDVGSAPAFVDRALAVHDDIQRRARQV
ncbi:MAG: lyase family protein [Actinomycetes bacterium]